MSGECNSLECLNIPIILIFGYTFLLGVQDPGDTKLTIFFTVKAS